MANAKTKLDVWNIDYIDEDKWEEIPTEDLWMDGELNSNQVMHVMYIKVIKEGDWKLIRRKDE
tara:strand:+ start:1484 stop:1672 length:189 start_codon:yes stop_codon:yes gene_type:complete